MLKVFLVEDEFVVREGIKNNIDWVGYGFEFCGDAADGELAYPLIQKEQPDIIITDIRMPFMDGLELSSLVKKELPQSKIIILSGYEEFKYAQEAIKIGVAEYLLKPINGADLIRTVKRVGRQILHERVEKENFECYRREMEENETYMKRRFFNDMLEGSLSIAKVLERGKEFGLELSAKNYQIMLFKYDITGEEEAYSKVLLDLARELCSVNSRFSDIMVFDRAIEGSAVLIKGDSIEQLEAVRDEYLAQMKAILTRYPDVHYFGGIGKIVGRLTHLSDSFESAVRAFSYRFIIDESTIISCSEISEHPLGQGLDSSLGSLELGGLNLKKVDGFLRNGEAGEITFFAEEFLRGMERTSKNSLLLRQYILMNTYITVVTFLKEIGASDASVEEPFKGPGQIHGKIKDPQKIRAYILRLFTDAIERRDAIRTRGYLRMIERAKEYINEHYADESISLNDTAAYVNISPSHFSAVFSRETGKSFIKYLTDLRMKKAKELLKCTDMRCSEISTAIGYKDPHYFSYLFKKLQNCSPMQYRASL